MNWLSNNINEYVQLKEYEILISCDLNLNMATGSDIFESILKMSNPEYDFSDTVKVVDRLSQNYIFYSDNCESAEFNEYSQSVIQFGCFKIFTEYMGWQSFYSELIQFIQG